MRDKILITSLNNEKGAGILIYNLSIELSKRYCIDLLYRAKIENYLDKKNINNIISLNESYKINGNINKILNLIIRLYKIYKIIKKGKYTTIISNGDLINIFFCFFKYFFQFKLITVSHGSARTIIGTKLKILYKLLYKKSDIFLTVSHENALIFKKYKFHNNINTIYNIIDENNIKKLSKENIERKEKIFFPKDKIKFMIVARLVKGKGIEEIINIFSKLNTDKYILNIIGDGEEYNKYKTIIEKKGLKKNINLLGYKKNPYTYINKSDILISNSYSEALPTTLIEANILGKYIISSNCISGPKEIIVGKNFHREIKKYPYINNTGILYDMDIQKNEKEKIIIYILENEILEFGKKRNIEKNNSFSSESIIKQWKNFLSN